MIHVLGDLNVDLILSGMTVPPAFGKEIIGTERSMAPGGSSANVAIILATTSVPVRFFGCIGNDFHGDFLVSALQSYGMNTDTVARTDRDRTCITVSLTYPNDRMFITDLGTLKSNTLADFPAGYLADAEHLHLGSFFLQIGLRPAVGQLLEDARANGMTTSLDMGGDPADTWDISDLLPALPCLDWFVPNADEITGITGCSTVPDALAAFDQNATGIVVKAGADGAYSRCNGEIRHYPGTVVEVVDTTGAGDCFNAGFLSAICSGATLDDAVNRGNEWGAAAVRCLGLPIADENRPALS